MRVGRPDIPTIVAANSAKTACWRPRDRDVGPRFGNGFDQNKAPEMPENRQIFALSPLKSASIFDS
jgi:hypothetical protein